MVQSSSQPQPPSLSNDPTEDSTKVTLSPLPPSNIVKDDPVIELPQVERNETHEETTRYNLPPRSTRGVPPRRYDPEY